MGLLICLKHLHVLQFVVLPIGEVGIDTRSLYITSLASCQRMLLFLVFS